MTKDTRTTLQKMLGEAEPSASAPAIRRPWMRERVPAPLGGDSLTHQSHAESCDINTIIRQFDRTGVLPPPRRPAQYGDVSELSGDLTERAQRASEVLAKVDAHVKNKAKSKSKSKPASTEEQRDLPLTPSSPEQTPPTPPAT